VWDTEEEDDPEVEAALGVAHRRRKRAHTPRPCHRSVRSGAAERLPGFVLGLVNPKP
jgi:hypothetical protein